jgi:hypothetical protein
LFVDDNVNHHPIESFSFSIDVHPPAVRLSVLPQVAIPTNAQTLKVKLGNKLPAILLRMSGRRDTSWLQGMPVDLLLVDPSQTSILLKYAQDLLFRLRKSFPEK